MVWADRDRTRELGWEIPWLRGGLGARIYSPSPTPRDTHSLDKEIALHKVAEFKGALVWTGAANYALWGRAMKECNSAVPGPHWSLSDAKGLVRIHKAGLFLFAPKVPQGIQYSQALGFTDYGYTGRQTAKGLKPVALGITVGTSRGPWRDAPFPYGIAGINYP
jgi:hypothetical protein